MRDSDVAREIERMIENRKPKMNERIKELADQAGFSFKYKTAPNELNPGHTRQDLEKFAELIVRECIGCCEQVISDPVPKSVDTWLNGGSQCIDEIKQHFGVEE
jgi:hypothetical protein